MLAIAALEDLVAAPEDVLDAPALEPEVLVAVDVRVREVTVELETPVAFEEAEVVMVVFVAALEKVEVTFADAEEDQVEEALAT